MSGEGGRARVLGLVMPQGAGDAMAAGVQCTQQPWGGSQLSSAGSATPDAESSSLLELFSLPFTSPQPSLLLLLHRLLDFTTNGTPSSCSRSLPLL